MRPTAHPLAALDQSLRDSPVWAEGAKAASGSLHPSPPASPNAPSPLLALDAPARPSSSQSPVCPTYELRPTIYDLHLLEVLGEKDGTEASRLSPCGSKPTSDSMSARGGRVGEVQREGGHCANPQATANQNTPRGGPSRRDALEMPHPGAGKWSPFQPRPCQPWPVWPSFKVPSPFTRSLARSLTRSFPWPSVHSPVQCAHHGPNEHPPPLQIHGLRSNPQCDGVKRRALGVTSGGQSPRQPG